MGVDGLSHREILKDAPRELVQNLYEVNSLDRVINETFTVSTKLIQQYQKNNDTFKINCLWQI